MSNRRTREVTRRPCESLGDGRARVLLTQGRFAVIDASDVGRVAGHCWCFRTGGAKRNMLYAEANIKIGGQWKRVLLHRFILQAPPGVQVDHIDGDGLNCTRSNLRLATHADNMRNTRAHSAGTSRFKGVYWSRVMRRWHAKIMKDRTSHDLGYFDDEEEAARAYDVAAKDLHGTFARLNFPEATTT